MKENKITAWNEVSLSLNVMHYNRKLLMRGFVVKEPYAWLSAPIENERCEVSDLIETFLGRIC